MFKFFIIRSYIYVYLLCECFTASIKKLNYVYVHLNDACIPHVFSILNSKILYDIIIFK